jgi:phenylacetate-CoA ligase
MAIYETMKKFLKKSSLLEKTALHVYESIPFGVRNRMLLGPAFVRWTMLLKESDNWDLGRFRDYQFDQVKNLLIHSADSIPYYRKLFSEIGFRPGTMNDFDDFRKIPFLFRKKAQEVSEQLVDERLSLGDLLTMPTSGSSGLPLVVRRNRDNYAAFIAFRTKILERAGYVPGAREVMFWPMVSLGRKTLLPYMRYGDKLILSIRHLTPDWLRQTVKAMADFKPRYVMGFPSVLSVVSSYIKHENPVDFSTLKSVVTYAERMDEWQRSLIEDAFGVKVFSMYAMVESPVIGGECEHAQTMHLHPLYGYTEFADISGECKEIVATGLTTAVMPFIRYLTGDVVTQSRDFCELCGRYHTVVDSIEGRINDFLIGRGGEIIPRLMPWIKTFPNVQQFQFLQRDPGETMLMLVKTVRYTERDTVQIRSRLDSMLGVMKDCIKIEIEFVDEIPATLSGKARMVSQHLDVRSYLKT